MPSKPPRICNRCKQPAPSGRPCPCRPAFEGSAWTNGSDRRWRTTRRNKLARDPLCQWPNCHRLATQVDHRIPLKRGGSKYGDANLQSLCEKHHDEKTQAESRAR